MITTEQVQQVIGTTVRSSDGDKIGKVGQVYFDDVTGQPAWVTVATGLFGSNESFVPVDSADVRDGELTVPFSKDKVKDAPNVAADQHLSEAEEAELYRYYGVEYSSAGTDTYAQTDTTDYSKTARHGDDVDDAMTLSEERVDVGTERVETGRARLRKHVVTENVTKTVPVTREEVRIEREPITDANRDRAVDGPEITENEHEVVLHEERPVVHKETVPTERVRLGTEQVTTEETVSEQVRHEEIDTERDGGNRR
ncbi:photosystem reaction center subunit H [Actinotalea ferrariae CF5-4]|uniref:Photosystem reaction center subunit H n=1 Tax=Actinotalea ferrariae CF5-4 TaxID=948458 RepID=A0A021VSW9_9CELL|nr:PRC and DUF2382 domain-containing protein [Actinotalea ferrariae]EYR63145.1 photosystem reaction center subunit H [Actinotalea ferrariae CF5-4]